MNSPSFPNKEQGPADLSHSNKTQEETWQAEDPGNRPVEIRDTRSSAKLWREGVAISLFLLLVVGSWYGQGNAQG